MSSCLLIFHDLSAFETISMLTLSSIDSDASGASAELKANFEEVSKVSNPRPGLWNHDAPQEEVAPTGEK